MLCSFAFFLVAVLPSDPPAYALTQSVDLVEVNHYFDEAGKPVFDQLIYYDWDHQATRYSVIAWRLIKNSNQMPIKQAGADSFASAWHDGKSLRIIYADRMYESWTQFDPENAERAFLPKDQRADLIRMPPKR